MLAVYCRREGERRRVAGLALPSAPMLWSDRPGSFHRYGRCALCALAVTPSLRHPSDRTAVTGFARHAPRTPLVVVTRPTPEKLHLLRDVAVEACIRPERAAAELPGVIRRASEARFPELWSESFLASPRIASPLALALVVACRADPPFGTVSAWARAAGMDRRTLWRHWRAAVGGRSGREPALDGRSPPEPHDFLVWLQLHAAVRRKRPGWGWEWAAREAGSSLPTLRRRARALLDRRLSELGPSRAPEVRAIFRQRVLDPLLEGTGETD